MDIWNILDIEKTTDIKAIKKAYAKMLKVHNPEDDPEGFMRLREAYDEAIRRAEFLAKRKSLQELDYDIFDNNDTFDDVDDFDDNSVFFEINPSKEKEPFDNEYPKHEEDLKDLEINSRTNNDIFPRYEKAEALYNDIFKRREISCWQKLFTEMSIDEYKYFSENAWNFFNTNCCLPHSVWKFIDSEFSIFEDSRFRWTKLVQYDFGLSFEFFDQSTSIDYSSFAKFRFLAFECFMKGDYKGSIEYLMKAEEIFNNDPLIYRLKGISSFYLRNYDDAIEALANAFSKDRKDVDSLLFRGNAYIKKHEFEKASQNFYKVIKIDKDNKDANKGMIKCLYYLKKYELLKQYLINFRSRYPKVDLETDILQIKYEKKKLSTKLKYISDFIKNFIDRIKNPSTPLAAVGSIIIAMLALILFFIIVFSPIGLIVFIVAIAYFSIKSLNNERKGLY